MEFNSASTINPTISSYEDGGSSTSSSTAPTANPTFNPPPSSPMLRWLSLDGDSPSICIQLLRLKDMAALHSSCKSWKNYIDYPPQHVWTNVSRDVIWSSNTTREAEVDEFSLQLRGRLQRYAKSFYLLQQSDSSTDSSVQEERHPLQILRIASYFTMLAELNLELDFSQLAESNFDSLFPALAHSLTSLILRNTDTIDRNQISMADSELSDSRTELDVVHEIFIATGRHLHRLQDLDIQFVSHQFYCCFTNRQVRKYQLLSFAFLQCLTQLRSFSLTPLVSFSRQQMEELLLCKSLKLLCAGEFTQHNPSLDQNRTRPQWIQDGIALLHHLPYLESISALVDEFCEDCIPHLIRIKSLTQIEVAPRRDYSFLLQLPLLTRLSYRGTKFSPIHEQMILSQLITAISLVPSLTNLQLQDTILKQQELKFLFKISHVSQFTLSRVQLDPYDSFAFAQSLTSLHLCKCHDLNNNLIDWSAHLFVIPNLRYLRIVDSKHEASGSFEVSEGERPLQLRMPLTKVRWHRA